LDLEIGEVTNDEPLPDGTGVVATVEVQRADLAEIAGGGEGVEGGFQHGDVVTVGAIAIAHAIGTPLASQPTDHFQPDLPLSQGFGPVPSPP
jgi:hypothetical protein